MTPWLPIGLTLLVALSAAMLVRWRWRSWTLASSTGLLVLALASFLPETINTAVVLFMGLPLLLLSLAGFLAVWIARRRRRRRIGRQI